ncbi:UDP-N-acetylglucosamine transporter yea4 [Lecanosticta acicola]|uniref:UDP-N-acetylglucosamine transporter yea4 n=1 Tax=Lecanosticta acicola TaxID=111012 RepID=A0AAI8YWQ8_9PEZI|nr:UDP-N-acetylglucosamine transporter yea4 [Lecanosticta acicola]
MVSGLEPLATTALIFGGCCTNVFALENIVKLEASSGLIITFFQFVLTTGFAYFTQFEPGSPLAVKKSKVPFPRWAFIAFMFFSINMLNNWAFAYDISVPVHIILRSFGSVTTMIAGVLRGKRYSVLQVFSVVLLTVGVLVSAWADSESKGKSMSVETGGSTSEFTKGLAILLVAQFMGAYQGAYTEDTYAMYKASWTENLFYSHLFSLPLFLPLSAVLQDQYRKLAATPYVNVRQYLLGALPDERTGAAATGKALESLRVYPETMPKGILFLLTNAVTQLACISGVNLLSAKSSAVTVTIVLNVRKLVSFMLSTLIFGHQLSGKMILGSALVFGSGALYGWETSWRLPRERQARAKAEGSSSASKEK